MPSDIPAFVSEQLTALEVVVTPEQLTLLGRYLDALLEANERFNLTGIRDREEAWRRHIIDSLTVLPGLAEQPAGALIADVGSGGGLPGIPLAICRPDLRFVLIEATGKKARFLQQCVDELGLSHVQVLNQRAEQVGQDPQWRQRFAVVTCRAVGPMRELLEYGLPLCTVGGYLAAIKGPSVEQELEPAGDALQTLGGGELQVIEAYPPAFGIQTVIVVVEKANPTPKRFPRPAGQARHEPL